MFDEFRQQANQSELDEEEELDDSLPPPLPPRSKRFLGMTPPQRFVISIILLMMTCILSVMCLLVTEKIVPPF
jgi:hypothetical protein